MQALPGLIPTTSVIPSQKTRGARLPIRKALATASIFLPNNKRESPSRTTARLGGAFSESWLRDLLLQLPVAEVEADIDAHHGDVENVEIERKVMVVRHELGRNAADVLKSLQLLMDYEVDLVSVDDAIDSSTQDGRLTLATLSAVAEIERENITVHFLSGKMQKLKEGGWPGGAIPYGVVVKLFCNICG